MKKTLAVALILMLCVLTGCKKEATPQADPIPYPIVTIEMEDGHVMQLELYPEIAPNTVANFVNLIEQGFYDGLTFHRVVPGFVIQGGDPLGNGTGGPGYTIKGEFTSNGFVGNDLSHTRGVLSMARAGNPDSAGSQFFIMHNKATSLDGNYAAFGKLIGEDDGTNSNYETLDLIGNTVPDANERPLVEWKIKKMTVDTKGYQYTVVKNEE